MNWLTVVYNLPLMPGASGADGPTVSIPTVAKAVHHDKLKALHD
jgi:hypothetical protein